MIMNKNIIILTDYKGFFGSKQYSPIYRGGMDIPKLIQYFSKQGYHAKAVRIADLNMVDILQNRPFVLYNSAEDKHGFYKSFIEDVIFNLEENGIQVLPKYAYLKAHNNKVAMELLRMRSNYPPIQTIQTKVFGTFEEVKAQAQTFKYPVVIKAAAGAMSKGVGKAESPEQLIQKAKSISKSRNFWHDLKDVLRLVKYRKKYVKESFHRKKIIVQNLIPNLSNDWKVLVYGNRCYALYRGVRKGDFRASGSGDFQFRKEIPEGMLDYAIAIKNYFNVPHISLDIGFDGKVFHLIEFQFINFGTTTIEKAPFYFIQNNSNWDIVNAKSDLEEIYVDSVCNFIENEYKKDK
jgi:glutathione synthase/RimK-type ligase-like ATP-grasp enzyme